MHEVSREIEISASKSEKSIKFKGLYEMKKNV